MRQGETRPLGRRTHHPTKGNKKGYDWRQRETRPLGRRTHHPTKGKKKEDKLGDKMRQGLAKADTPSNKGTHIGGGKMGDKVGDKLGDKGDKALGTGIQCERQAGRQSRKQAGRQVGRPREGGHTIQQKETRETS